MLYVYFWVYLLLYWNHCSARVLRKNTSLDIFTGSKQRLAQDHEASFIGKQAVIALRHSSLVCTASCFSRFEVGMWSVLRCSAQCHMGFSNEATRENRHKVWSTRGKGRGQSSSKSKADERQGCSTLPLSSGIQLGTCELCEAQDALGCTAG